MSVGAVKIGEEIILYGYESIEDWLCSTFESFPAPWSIADLRGKYYGTKILDAEGTCIIEIWISLGDPSPRQRGSMTDAEWQDYNCDCHYESLVSFRIAEAVIALRNVESDCDEQSKKLLILILLNGCQWNEKVWDKIRCGGPNRRLLIGDEILQDHFRARNAQHPLLVERSKTEVQNQSE